MGIINLTVTLNFGEFLDWPRILWLLKKDSVP